MKASEKYKEIFKLKKMLEDAQIPFEYIEGYGYSKDIIEKYPDICEHYQICYPSSKDRWISVVEGFGTYGFTRDRLEIMGGFTPLETFEKRAEVIGWLTANNVFKRIKNHYEMERKIKE